MAEVADPAARFPLALDDLDAAVEEAIATGDAGRLRVLGYGEVTLVLGWPFERSEYAVKRLPPIRDEHDLAHYRGLLEEYVATLTAAGVAVVPTEVRACRAATGELHAYLVQPLIPRERLLDRVLRDAGPNRGEHLIRQVVATVAGVVDGHVGLDAQAANWAVDGDRIACFDVSTPMLRADGEELLDLGPFLSIYPWALRPVLRRTARDVISQFHDPRTVLLDLASNLVKENLERWLPATLAAAGEVVTPAITEREVRRYFRRDRRLWLLMQRLRRLDRAWQRHVRHRSYGFLLPPPYRYGPPWQQRGDLT
jgi:hypothetical protein